MSYQLRWLVGQRHVGEPTHKVVKWVTGKIRRSAWSGLSRDERAKIIRAIRKYHADNRKLYRSVMGGI